jgi:hypothetical protein
MSVPAGADCRVTVRFQPSGVGARTAQLVITDNEVASPLRIDLAGTGS